MKKIILITVLTLFNYLLNAQSEEYPKGIYMSFQEILDKTPSSNHLVDLEKRSKGKIKMNGGNDYQLNPVNKNVNKKVLKKQAYAYSDGNDLFLNAFHYEVDKVTGLIDYDQVKELALKNKPKLLNLDMS